MELPPANGLWEADPGWGVALVYQKAVIPPTCPFPPVLHTWMFDPFPVLCIFLFNKEKPLIHHIRSQCSIIWSVFPHLTHSEVFWFRRWGRQWHAAISWDSFLACPFFPLGCVWVFPVSWEGKQQDQDAVVGHQGGVQPRGEASVKISECPWAFCHPAFLLHSTSVFTESVYLLRAWEDTSMRPGRCWTVEAWEQNCTFVTLEPFPFNLPEEEKAKAQLFSKADVTFESSW